MNTLIRAQDLASLVSVDVYESIAAPYRWFPVLPACQQAYQNSVLHNFELQEAKRAIEEISRLPENWDGYGAIPILSQTKKNALATAEAMLNSVPVPDVAPNSNGTISMEWESGVGVAFLEIGQSRYAFYIDRLEGGPILADGPADEIPPYLGLLISSILFPGVPGTAASTTIEGNVQLTGPRRGL